MIESTRQNESDLKRYCLIGVKGIGKTTLVKSVLEEIPHVDYLIGSQILRKLVSENQQNFAQFDYFPENQKENYRIQAIKYMIKRQNDLKKVILVDGHTSLYNPNSKRVEKVFTDSDCQFFTDFILYEAQPSLIYERRKHEISKKRILDLEIIQQEIEKENYIAHQIAKEYNIEIHNLKENSHESLEILGKKLIKILTGSNGLQN